VSAEWKTKVGSGTAVEWPAGGRQGNEGSGNIGQTKNSIGTSNTLCKQNKLTYAALVNKGGKTVQPPWKHSRRPLRTPTGQAPGYYVILTDQPGDKSWPITASTFILMHRRPAIRRRPRKPSSSLMAFAKGGKMAEELDYIPMPEPVVKLIERPGRPTSRADDNSVRARNTRARSHSAQSGSARIGIREAGSIRRSGEMS